ncbi:MAG TPA: hypothetical protein VF553_01570 [Pyrinomonadaceae bacterium]|jgi:hypothetical protein
MSNEDAAIEEPEGVETSAPVLTEQASSSPLVWLKGMGQAARSLFGNWRALLVLLVLYGVMVASAYFFIASREASLWQVLSTFTLAALLPILFFIIQVIGIRYVEAGTGTKELLRAAVRDFWKLIVVTVPLLLLAWLLVYLFGKFQPSVPAAVSEAGRAGAAARPSVHSPAELFSWKEVILTTLRALLLYLVLPLLAIRLWINVARAGLGHTLRNLKSVAGLALAPGAVLVYALGLLLFGVIPYFLITTHLSRGGAWMEITLLGVRLLLASLFILFGWLITLGALSKARLKE